MSAPGAPKIRSGNFLLVGILLTISVLLEQYCLAPLVPQLSELGGLRPMIVFLDIPLALPNIDWIPVSLLFTFLYGMVISPELANRGKAPGPLRRKKIWAALTGWWLLLLLILTGAGLYSLVQDALPRQVRNGIDSFGIRADITLPYPSGDLVHLHGSMLLLLSSFIGFRLLLKKTMLPPVVELAHAPANARPNVAATPPAASLPARPRVSATTAIPKRSRLPDSPPPAKKFPAGSLSGSSSASPTRPREVLTTEPPPDCRLTTPPPVAVIMPRPTPRIGTAQPCVTSGFIEPAKT
ncbi:MAG TPA: hypothetical protein VHE54_17140 [Puia sp.]|nr:hypothetical protein [Puia sp.]